MALPDSNISTSLVGDALGSSSRDVGTLCTHANVNKWSKNKPVSVNKIEGLTSADRLGVDYGLVPPATQTNYTPVYNANWVYNKPTGGASSPYRLGDFRGYEHLATPIATLSGDITINRTMTNVRPLMLTMRRYGTDTLLGVDDYAKPGGLAAWYYGAVFVKGGVEYLQTAKGTLGSGAFQIELDLTKAPFNVDGTVQVYHVIVSEMVDPIVLKSTRSLGYRSLPTADNVSNSNTIKIMSGLGVDFFLEQMSYDPFINYMNIGPFTTEDGPDYPSNGGAWFKVSLYNLSPDPIFVPTTGWDINASPNYWGDNTNYLPATLYDGNFNTVSSLTVPPQGGSVVIYIGSSTLLNGGISYTPTSKTFFSNITFRYNNAVMATQGLKWSMGGQ